MRKHSSRMRTARLLTLEGAGGCGWVIVAGTVLVKLKFDVGCKQTFNIFSLWQKVFNQTTLCLFIWSTSGALSLSTCPIKLLYSSFLIDGIE